MNDAHGFDLTLAQVKERAVVIASSQCLIHFLQPLAWIIGAARALRHNRQECTDQGARNDPLRANLQRSGHGAVRTSGLGGCAARSGVRTGGASSSISKSASTPRWPNPEEYLLCANT